MLFSSLNYTKFSFCIIGDMLLRCYPFAFSCFLSIAHLPVFSRAFIKLSKKRNNGTGSLPGTLGEERYGGFILRFVHSSRVALLILAQRSRVANMPVDRCDLKELSNQLRKEYTIKNTCSSRELLYKFVGYIPFSKFPFPCLFVFKCTLLYPINDYHSK